MKHIRVRLAATLLSLTLLGLAGCATSMEVNYTTTTSDGQRLTFRMVNGRADHGSEAGIQTDTPNLEPSPKEKQMVYLLRLFDKNPQPPRSVKVEDVSDESAFLLVEDKQPVVKNQEWRGVTRTFSLDDPAMKWLTYLDQSFRVYRFTVVLADGRTVVLHEGVMVPAYAKAMIRHVLGKDY